MRQKLRMKGVTHDNAPKLSLGADYWNSLSWKPVDVSGEDLGNFSDSIFFGLEELDGNSYLEQKKKKSKALKSEEEDASVKEKSKTKKRKATEALEIEGKAEETSATHEQPKKKKQKNKKEKEINQREEKESHPLPNKQKGYIPMDSNELSELTSSRSSWDNVSLNASLHQSLLALDFKHPTPIQSSSIPLILSEKELADVVGIAETGSGKTLAFVLPIIHSIITSWQYCQSCKIPFAMIISPTRELSMQISSVIKDISKVLQGLHSFLKIRTATVVGGMSEDKQRRLLATRKTPLHIIVATPGRLNEIFQDPLIEAFEDLSQIRYLVIDEADRMMEEGHFSELYRIFSRFRDHDEIVRRGEDVREVMRKRQKGTTELEAENAAEEGNEEEDPFAMNDDEMMKIPSNNEEMEVEEADPESENIEDLNEDIIAENEGEDQAMKDDSFISFALQRQTLLFTATGLETSQNKKVLQKSYLTKKQAKKLKLKGTVKGLASDCSLPVAIKELLSVAAIQPTIRVVDVTHSSSGAVIESGSVVGDDEQGSVTSVATAKTLVALPKFLSQFEVRIPTEDKDIYTYYYLMNNEGRTLIFVNSIKTARRLDGLLRALQFHCRTIHGDLPQRQRIKALETFQSSPRGILVATDIAARGLDIPKISSVIHYDIARTPQVYVHRSGRTARANQSGKTISLVTPDDYEFHTLISEYVTGKKKQQQTASVIQPYKVEGNVLPYLRDRVQLAKKIFTLSFVLSHELKEKHWLQEQADRSDLMLDEYLLEEVSPSQASSSSNSKKSVKESENENDGNKKSHKKKKGSTAAPETEKQIQQKKQLQELRKELSRLLETPIPSLSRLNNPAVKSNAISSQANDWRRRKVGFFVYTPPTN